jgi:hypothetical protein
MKEDEIVYWVRHNIEPITDLCGKNAFRCAAYMKDGLYLPCVLFCEAQAHTDLAIRRFEELRKWGITKKIPSDYSTVVKSFVASGNSVNLYDLDRVEVSPFAIPVERLMEVRGETSMAWTAFAAIMDDGKEFSFGTSFLMEFFNMPDGYAPDRIKQIIPHRNEVKPVYREKPFFTCFVDNVEFRNFISPMKASGLK